jgi:hypothetical protein
MVMNISSRKRMFLLVSNGSFIDDIKKSVEEFNLEKSLQEIKDFFSKKHTPEEIQEAEKAVSSEAKAVSSENLDVKTNKTPKQQTVAPIKKIKPEKDALLKEVEELMSAFNQGKQQGADIGGDLPEDKDFKATMSSAGASSPAALRALYDADKKWSKRNKKSDGIMGDVSHQTSSRMSDHNTGNAVDITHDPTNGPSGDEIAAMALQDPRTKYVIWNRVITKPGKYTKKYDGPNPHTGHVHISIKPEMRNDSSPWLWGK